MMQNRVNFKLENNKIKTYNNSTIIPLKKILRQNCI